MSESIDKLSGILAAIFISLCPQAMLQVILPLTLVNLSICPLKHALAVVFTINEVSDVAVATRVSFSTLPICQAIVKLTLVDLTVDPLVLALDVARFALLHAAFVNISVLHVGCAFARAAPLAVKLSKPR